MGSNLWEDKLSEVMSSDASTKESKSKGTFPMDITAILEEHFGWTVVGFSRAASSRQFELVGDSPSPFFHTRIQYQMYQGGIEIRMMHPDQQWLCWAYLQTHA